MFTTPLHPVPRLRTRRLYLYSPICLHDVNRQHFTFVFLLSIAPLFSSFHRSENSCFVPKCRYPSAWLKDGRNGPSHPPPQSTERHILGACSRNFFPPRDCVCHWTLRCVPLDIKVCAVMKSGSRWSRVN